MRALLIAISTFKDVGSYNLCCVPLSKNFSPFALSGQGLVQIALKNYEKALDSYIEAHKLYPSMRSTLKMMEKLRVLIQQESI